MAVTVHVIPSVYNSSF